MEMCDSFSGEGEVGVSATLPVYKPLPATSHSAAPLPEKGFFYYLSNLLVIRCYN